MLWREIESLSGTVIQCSFCILLRYIVVGENNGEVVVVVVVVGGGGGDSSIESLSMDLHSFISRESKYVMRQHVFVF